MTLEQPPTQTFANQNRETDPLWQLYDYVMARSDIALRFIKDEIDQQEKERLVEQLNDRYPPNIVTQASSFLTTDMPNVDLDIKPDRPVPTSDAPKTSPNKPWQPAIKTTGQTELSKRSQVIDLGNASPATTRARKTSYKYDTRHWQAREALAILAARWNAQSKIATIELSDLLKLHDAELLDPSVISPELFAKMAVDYHHRARGGKHSRTVRNKALAFLKRSV